MADYDISFIGIDDLQHSLKAGQDLNDVKEVVKEDTAYMHREIARETPVDTTFLRRSENISIEDNGLTGRVTATADYASYQEYGTRFIYGKFYMKKGNQKAGEKFLKDMEELMK